MCINVLMLIPLIIVLLKKIKENLTYVSTISWEFYFTRWQIHINYTVDAAVLFYYPRGELALPRLTITILFEFLTMMHALQQKNCENNFTMFYNKME